MALKCTVYFLLFVFNSIASISQDKKITSLLTILQTQKEDSNKVKTLNELTSELWSRGNSQKAMEYATTAISLSQKINYKKGEGKAHGNLGLIYAGNGRLKEALDQHMSALKIRQEINDLPGLGNSYTNMGHIYLDQGRLAEALKSYEATLKVRVETVDGYGVANSYNDIGNVYQYQGNYDASLKNHIKSLKIRQEINDEDGVAASYGNMGTIYREQGNFTEALKSYFLSLKIADKTGNKITAAHAFNNIGNTYEIQGNHAEALKNHFLSLKIKQEIGYKAGIAESYNNIGIIYETQKNHAAALENLFLALQINEELGLKYNMVRVYNNIAGIFKIQAENFKLGNQADSVSSKLNEGLKNHFAALKIAKEINDKEGLAMNYGNMANLYKFKNDYYESLKYYIAATEIFEQMGQKRNITTSYINIGQLYSVQEVNDNKLKKEYHKKALEYLNKGLAMAIETGVKPSIKEAYYGLKQAYYNNGNYKKAIEYSNLYIAINDSLFNDESSKKIENLKIQYEVDKALSKEKLEREKLALEEKIRHEKELSAEKIKQEIVIADEKSRHEKALYEENFRHQLALAKEKNNREQLLLRQKLMSEKDFAEAKANQEKKEAEEKERHQVALFEEKIRYDKAVADEKQKQDKLFAQKEKRNNMLLAGAAIMIITGLFVILLLRQRHQKKIAIDKANAIHKMAELEMQSLRTQLNPHFMFNSLNSIQELILLEENERSHSYLSRFGKLLRMLLENAEKPFISVRKEVDFLQLYLGLENLRVPDLQYSISTDPKLNTDKILIPNMILQPYIENAIWHGLSHKEKDKQLQIRIYRQNGIVNYEIEDNGVGRKKAAELKSLFRQKHQSKGMELLSKRFKLLNEEYSSDINTTITDVIKNNEVAGTLVTIKVPANLSDQILN